jgi:CBS-domain-containing membrane protein
MIQLPVCHRCFGRTLSEAFRLFEANTLTTLPVWGQAGHFISSGDSNLSTHRGKQYIAILSLLDCVSFMLNHPMMPLSNVTVFSVIGSSIPTQTLWVVHPEKPLISCLEPMAKGVHAFLIGSEASDDPLTLLSQTDVLHFVYGYMQAHSSEQLGTALAKLAGPKPVICAKMSDMMQQVIRKMTLNSITSIPIVDTTGSVIDSFSITDMRHFLYEKSQASEYAESFKEMLNMPIELMLESCRTESRPGVFVQLDALLGNTLKIALETKAHHIWIGDHQKKPIGVLSYTDMLAILWDFAKSRSEP